MKTKIKDKKCRIKSCNKKFTPMSDTQVVCG